MPDRKSHFSKKPSQNPEIFFGKIPGQKFFNKLYQYKFFNPGEEFKKFYGFNFEKQDINQIEQYFNNLD